MSAATRKTFVSGLAKEIREDGRGGETHDVQAQPDDRREQRSGSCRSLEIPPMYDERSSQPRLLDEMGEREQRDRQCDEPEVGRCQKPGEDDRRDE